MDLIPIYGALISTIGILFGVVKWILSVKIEPIQEKIESLDEQNKKLDIDIDDLKKSVLEELKQISRDNFEFRREYEAGIADIKLLLAEKHILKDEYNRDITELHKRVNVSHDIKTIKESLKQLNS